MTMLYIGVLSIALCAVQVYSFPASVWDTGDDTKVARCIVEVISNVFNQPTPLPTSQECLQIFLADEKIVSILRRQNLLKELQELAAQGAVERQKQKKNGGFGEELSSILEKQRNKPLPSEKSQVPPLLGKSPEEEEKRQPEEEERRRSSERTEEEDSPEELESNEISKREETAEDEEIDNRITDEINEMEPPRDNQEDSGEKEPMTKKDQEADETEDPENHKRDSNETDNEEDDTQREDNSMRIPEDFNKDSTSDSSKETNQDADTSDCAEENAGVDDDASSKDLENSKRWNKMDELAKELRAKKCATRSSEDDPDRSMKIPPKEPKYLNSQEAEDRQQWQRSREDSGETEAPILKREEEGSANRKTEDPELESLAAIEAELENVAHKLHDLRRG